MRPTLKQEIDRCNLEIERIKNEDHANSPAWLVAMGQLDWNLEKVLIMKELNDTLADPEASTSDAGSSAAANRDDDVTTGILIALGIVYYCDAENAAEEIVKACDWEKLLRAAKREEDCYLPNLRRTIAFLKSTGKIGIKPKC